MQRVADFHKTAPVGMSTMLSNHDSFAGQRPFDQFGGNLAQYKLAAATYLLQPGTPFIYYGEEVGMAGGTMGGDPKLRTPMSWAGTPTAGFTTGTPYRSLSANVMQFNVAAQMADPASLLAHYKALVTLRRARPSLAGGAYEQVVVDGALLSFERRAGTERTRGLINYGPATVARLGGLRAKAGPVDLGPPGSGEIAADAAGQAELVMQPQSVQVLDLR